jgi:hypothetical protein
MDELTKDDTVVAPVVEETTDVVAEAVEEKTEEAAA